MYRNHAHPSNHCPRCIEPLTEYVAEAGSALACRTCGGMFLNRPLADEISRTFSTGLRDLDWALATQATAAPSTNETIYCPVCSRLMTRLHLRAAQVIFDACEAHGRWFDRLEASRFARACLRAKGARLGVEVATASIAKPLRASVRSSTDEHELTEEEMQAAIGDAPGGDLARFLAMLMRG